MIKNGNPSLKQGDTKKMFGVATPEIVQNTLDNQGKFKKIEPIKDSNGFTKETSDIYIKDGESVDLVFLAELPYYVPVHEMTITWSSKKKGTSGKFYPKETCQKIEGTSCVLCDAAKTNDSINAAAVKYFYPVLAVHGLRDKDTKTFKTNGEPAPALLMANIYILNKLNEFKDEFGSDFTSKVFTLSKLGKNTEIVPTTVYEGIGKSRKAVELYYEGEIPEIQPNFFELWSPRTSEDLKELYLRDSE